MNQPPEKRAVLCPKCNRLVSSDETRCPHCGLSNPGAWWKQHRVVRSLRSTGGYVRWIIAANVIMYLISLIIYPRASGFHFDPLVVLSPPRENLLLLGATGTLPIDRFHRWWTLASANYLHGGIFHLMFNLIAFRQIESLVSREFGTGRMVMLYHLSGVFGFWVSYMAGVPLTLGASAAVCGLIGSAVYYGKSRGGDYGRMIFKQVGGWAVSILVIGLLLPGINNWGHVGGFIAGVLLGMMMGYQEKRPENPVHRFLAAVVLIGMSGILVWAVIQTVAYQMFGAWS